jgi:Icc-related predicted phosphoesterase
VIRIAAVGDVHYCRESKYKMREYLRALDGNADLLFIAGDLTQHGEIEEAQALIEDLKEVPVPIAIVLGNHDYHRDKEKQIIQRIRDAGFTALDGETARFKIREHEVGVVGMKGFGGGFFGACVTEFGEHETKTFARHAKEQAIILKRELSNLKTDFKFVLLHFSPIEGTLLGENREIYPFLGSYLLAEAIDEEGADAVFHGHAHLGTERGRTPRGIPVRNVAQPVIRHAYNIYHFEAPVLLPEGRTETAQTSDSLHSPSR